MRPEKYCPKRLSPPIWSWFVDVVIAPVAAWLPTSVPFT